MIKGSRIYADFFIDIKNTDITVYYRRKSPLKMKYKRIGSSWQISGFHIVRLFHFTCNPIIDSTPFIKKITSRVKFDTN